MEKKKLIFKSILSPGDAVMMTCAIRDLHITYPDKYLTDVRTCCSEVWENNPYITKMNDDEGEIIDVGYTTTVNESNQGAYNFAHGYRREFEEKLGISIKQTSMFGNLYLSDIEKRTPSLIDLNFTGWDTPYWIIICGGKQDYTAKHWIQEYAQEVIDYFYGKIQFVQVGDKSHLHKPLNNVINLIGATSLRDLINLIYHADGVICPITFAMTAAAAVPPKQDKPNFKPCIVTAGGREPNHWNSAPNHQFIHSCGIYECNNSGGCWKSRTVKLNDGDGKDGSLCTNTVDFMGRKVQRCMKEGVKPIDVIRALEKYYDGDILQYLPHGYRMINDSWNNRDKYINQILKDKATYLTTNYARNNKNILIRNYVEQIKSNREYS